jgi:ribosome-binding factor A
MKQRTDRLNSLLKEVISEVVMRDVRDPRLAKFVTITGVDITKDLHHAKVLVSVIGTDLEKEQTIIALQAAASFIAITSSKKVVMRYFPVLTFKLDDSVDKHLRIDTLLEKIQNEQKTRDGTRHIDPTS